MNDRTKERLVQKIGQEQADLLVAIMDWSKTYCKRLKDDPEASQAFNCWFGVHDGLDMFAEHVASGYTAQTWPHTVLEEAPAA